MTAPPTLTHRAELALTGTRADLFRAAVRDRPASLFLEGDGSETAWDGGPLLALEPGVCAGRGGRPFGLDDLDRLVANRRARGGTAETGVAAVLAYDALEPDPRRDRDPERTPLWSVLSVDRSVRFLPNGGGLLTVRTEGGASEWARVADRLQSPLELEPREPAHVAGNPKTSLPRDSYLERLRRVKGHIARGDIYQANLSQRFSVGVRGDAAELYLKLSRTAPAPHAAFMHSPGLTLVSISPETFLRMPDRENVETFPIKGTRARGRSAEEDRRAACDLLQSEKDRAELVMIVDLERNDLSRVSVPGSVHVPELIELRSFPAVHHLVARVCGRLRSDVGIASLIRSTFPGGSITGAPKIRAMEILGQLEPVPRGVFTGSLFWFGDDGTLSSSILIRSLAFAGGRACLGAGGGIVADSEPELEWQESNHKARALSEALGFQPEEAR